MTTVVWFIGTNHTDRFHRLCFAERSSRCRGLVVSTFGVFAGPICANVIMAALEKGSLELIFCTEVIQSYLIGIGLSVIEGIARTEGCVLVAVRRNLVEQYEIFTMLKAKWSRYASFVTLELVGGEIVSSER